MNDLEWFKEAFPCDGGCSYLDGPEEDCYRHGRSPQELWEMIGETQVLVSDLADILGMDGIECDKYPDDPETCGWRNTVIRARNVLIEAGRL